MRILFNHGLLVNELYVNTPEKYHYKRWRYLNDTYGWNQTYEDALAEPFCYAMNLIINRILDEKERFKIPYSDAYIDFEIVTGDKFIEQRQNGRFSNIDFVESDFTGYFLNYFYKTKAYQKQMPIYLGGELKAKFIDGINSGVKYYTVKDFTLNDILPEIHKKFNDFKLQELKNLISHGFRRMHSAIKFGCAISLLSYRNKLVAYIGKLTLIPGEQIKQYSVRRDRKLRKIEGWKKTPFDGYYYIGLNENAMAKWVEANEKSRSIARFTNIIPRKIKEELYYKDKKIYVFRYKRKDFKGWAFWAEKLEVRKLEYLGYAYERKFYPEDKSWLEIKKAYEKREC